MAAIPFRASQTQSCLTDRGGLAIGDIDIYTWSGIPGEAPVGRRGWAGPKYQPTSITNRPSLWHHWLNLTILLAISIHTHGVYFSNIFRSFFWNGFLRTSEDHGKKRSPPDSWTPENGFLHSQSVVSCADWGWWFLNWTHVLVHLDLHTGLCVLQSNSPTE